MDGNKQVCRQIGGFFGTGIERDEHVLVACEDDLHLGIGFPDTGREQAGNLEREGLFIGLLVRTRRAGILAAMSGVDDDCLQRQVGA